MPAPIPPRPASFTPEGAPVGVEVDYVSFWQTRSFITPRIQLAHTNAASRQSSIEAAKRWSESAPGSHTLPHYQVDRDGRACKFLPTNRKGIANQTVAEYRGEHGSVQNWSLAYETADTGTLDDPTISDYTDVQAETLATIMAYESVVWDIPLELPTEWYGSGTASHTDPFGYPYWTNARGKTCPGAKKKARLRNEILLRAQIIKVAWLGGDNPIEHPPEDDDIMTPAQEAKVDALAASVQACFALIQQAHQKIDALALESSVQNSFTVVQELHPKVDAANAKLDDLVGR